MNFDGKTDLKTFLQQLKNVKIKYNYEIFYNQKSVGLIFVGDEIYNFLWSWDIYWKDWFSKKMSTKNMNFVVVGNTVYAIECNFHKIINPLQTCDFKKKQYKKIFSRLNIEVEYMYLLSDWFAKPQYKDVLDYIISVGCSYYFNYIPLEKLGLPVE